MNKTETSMFQFIITDLQDSLQYLPIGIVVGIIVYMVAILRNRGSKTKIKLLPTFLMGVYVTCLAYLVFFNREVGSRDGVALHLFETLGNGIRGDSYVVENVLLFVPFGVLFPWLCEHRRCGWTHAIIAGCLISTFIELIQWITKSGFCQLDDIIMNMLGTMIGYACYRLIRFLGTGKTSQNGI